MMTRLFQGYSRAEIEKKIDIFLAEEKPHKPFCLIRPITGTSTVFEYRGLPVREWRLNGHVRFDASVELF